MQVGLYGPSLIGTKLLLPLRLVVREMPDDPPSREEPAIDSSFADLVLVDEVMRVRAAREVRQGRIPLWDPDNYAGAPFVANNVSAVFSPYRTLDYLFPSPTTIAWAQLARALIAGMGAYLFFRRALRVAFWPAAVGAWCFPLCGYLVLWCGMGSSAVVSWLPWILLATDSAARRPRGWGGPALALVTAAVLLSGHLADGGQVLFASGLYAIWRVLTHLGWRRALRGAGLRPMATLTVAWMLGILIAAPQILTTLEYLEHSFRMVIREQNVAERPPLGLVALPQMTSPFLFGSTRSDQRYLLNVYLQESAAAGYAGLTTVFVFAPLAFVQRRRLRDALFWLCVAFFGAAGTIGIPGFQAVTRLPGLRLLTFNRLMFLTAFAVLALGVLGLHALSKRPFRWRAWMWIPPTVALTLAVWCVMRSVAPPQAVLTAGGQAVLGLFPAPAWFVEVQIATAALCLVAVAAWLVLRYAPRGTTFVLYGLPAFLLAEMLWNSYGVSSQRDPKRYYPEIPALARLRELPPGRICGERCLPPMLNQMYGLRDIRGYDGLDPRWLVELLLATEPPMAEWTKVRLAHAITLHHLAPVRSPIHDLLGVRYLVFAGPLPPGVTPLIGGTEEFDVSVIERPTALPRTFVPRHVLALGDERTTLAQMQRPDFDPRDIAYVEGPRPRVPLEIVGAARLVRETSGEVVVAYDMQTPGLVVLADTWYPGWRAWVDGLEKPILRTDYAVRGVRVPAGRGEIVFRYEPDSFWRGVRLCGAAALAVAAWCGIACYRQRSRR